MGLSSLYNRIALISPYCEIALRHLYWKNVKWLGKFNPNKNSMSNVRAEQPHVDFDLIEKQLRDWGVTEGSLLVVHSSFDSLRATGLSPIEIISRLRKLIGESGTLAMPVIRNYKEEPEANIRINKSYNPPKSIYNVRRTPVISGLLPTFLMRTPEAVISQHPLNPLCAVGPLATEMMIGNIDGENPSPHGPKSCWKFCLDHNAIVIGLGTDLRHHNTMGHVAEEAFGDWCWPDEEWYNIRPFVIENNKEKFDISVRERKPFWGMLHQAEINRYHDFIKNGVIKSKQIDGVLLEFEYAETLINFLRLKNKKGYPYFKF